MRAANDTWPRHFETEVLAWEGLTILVCYEPDWLSLGEAGLRPRLAHLEMQVLAPAGAPFPLSDTGYWSEFVDPTEAAEPAAIAAVVSPDVV